MNTSATLLHLQETETDFEQKTVDLSKYYHWHVYHTHDSRRSQAGYPDLSMTHEERHVYAELKSEKGKLSPEQRVWLVSLWEAGAEVFVWKPSYWEQVVDTLSGAYRGVRA